MASKLRGRKYYINICFVMHSLRKRWRLARGYGMSKRMFVKMVWREKKSQIKAFFSYS